MNIESVKSIIKPKVWNLSVKDRDLFRAMRRRGWKHESLRVIFASRNSDLRFHKYLIRKFTKWKTARYQAPSSSKTLIPVALRWDVWERDNFTCKHCGVRKHLAVDHIFPESLGGETTAANLQTLCKSCNSKKGNRVDG